MKNGITLYQGDCLEIMKTISDKSIDMILSDLPYGITARNKWDVLIPFAPLWDEYRRIIKDTGAIVLFGNGMFTAQLMLSAADIWRYNLIWEKTNPTGFLNANRMPLRSHEDICVFYKHLPKYHPQKTYGHERKVSAQKGKVKDSLNYAKYTAITYDSTERYPISILTFPKDTQKTALHPTQKPVALLEYLINTFTDEKDVVLDNCMGSGSTGIACINTKRHFIGIEKEKTYFSLARERIEERELRLF